MLKEFDLISLIGEQPIPNLLAVRALGARQNVFAFTPTTKRVMENLKVIIPNASSHEVEAYDLPLAVQQIKGLCTSNSVLNLTGGTKPMAWAGYEVARSLELPFVYLQSEGDATLLFWYEFKEGQPVLLTREELPALLTIADYFAAHGLAPSTGRSRISNAQESGLRQWFEKQVDECRTNTIFEGFEIDFILRRGNRVAVVEAKWKDAKSRSASEEKKGKKKGAGRRRGLDQLSTIGAREFLGTYTGKLLIVNKQLGPQLLKVAEDRHIEVLLLPGKTNSRTGRLELTSQGAVHLAAALNKLLGPRHS